MTRLSAIAAFVFLMVLASAANAQCLRCYGSPHSGGTCGESLDGYCSGDCCGNIEGAGCRIPDFLWECHSASPRGAFRVVLFQDNLPHAQFVPTCGFASRMAQQTAVPRLTRRSTV